MPQKDQISNDECLAQSYKDFESQTLVFNLCTWLVAAEYVSKFEKFMIVKSQKHLLHYFSFLQEYCGYIHS